MTTMIDSHRNIHGVDDGDAALTQADVARHSSKSMLPVEPKEAHIVVVVAVISVKSRPGRA